MLWFLLLLSPLLAVNVTVSVAQLTWSSPTDRLTVALQACIEASRQGADVVLLPSAWTQGEFSTIQNTFSQLAQSSHIAVGWSFLSAQFSTFQLVDFQGQQILAFNKSITSQPVGSISEQLPVVNLTTAKGTTFLVGAMAGEDVSFPESGRVLMVKGAQVVLVPANVTTHDNFNLAIKVRAMENQVMVVFANVAGPLGGNSSFSDPGGVVKRASPDAQLFTSTVDLQAISSSRHTSIWGDQFRRPSQYAELCFDGWNSSLKHLANVSLDAMVSVALLQMNPGASVQENLEIADKYVRQAAAQGADVVLMPELWSVGYDKLFPGISDPEALFHWMSDLSQPEDGPFVSHFRGLAQEVGVAIGVAYARSSPSLAPFNSISLIDRFGEIVYTYDKVHTCVFTAVESNTSPGNGYRTGVLRTKNAGDVLVGSYICYDREQPESARILASLHAAELLLVPNACFLSDHLLDMMATRAYENVVGVAMTNFAGPYMNGESSMWDAEGSVITQATAAENIVMGKFNISRIRQIRQEKSIRQVQKHKELCTVTRNPQFDFSNFYHRASGLGF